MNTCSAVTELPNINTDEITNKMSLTGPTKLITIDEVLLTNSSTDICEYKAKGSFCYRVTHRTDEKWSSSSKTKLKSSISYDQ